MTETTEVKPLADLTFPAIEYGVTEAALAELAQRYAEPDASTEEGYESCKQGCSELTSLRTAIETRRKDLKKPALDWGRNVDSQGKELIRRIKKIEAPVRAEKDRVDEIAQAEARKVAAAEERRVQTIRANITKIKATALEQQPGDTAADYQAHIDELNATNIDSGSFEEFLNEALTERDAALFKLGQWHDMAVQREADDVRREADRKELEEKQAELDAQAEKQKEEAERIAKGIQDAADLEAENERKAREAEEKRVDAIVSRIRELETFREYAEGSAALRDTILALDSKMLDKNDFAEKLEQAVAAKTDRLAELKRRLAEAEAREEQQRVEDEARLPDRDKLRKWLDTLIVAAVSPDVGSKNAQKIIARYGQDLDSLIQSLRKAIEKL